MEIAVSGVGRDTQGQERIGAMQRGGAVLLPIPLASPGGATWASAGQIPLQQLLPCAVGLLAAGVSLSQWFSRCGPGPASSASPENLKIQIASLIPDLWSQNPGAGSVMCALTSSCRLCVQVENYWLKQEVDREQIQGHRGDTETGWMLASLWPALFCMCHSFIHSLSCSCFCCPLCRSHSGPMTFKVCSSSSSSTSRKSHSGAKKPGVFLLSCWFSSLMCSLCLQSGRCRSTS